MPLVAKRTFSLPSAQSRYIDKMIKSGTYASGSEVVRAGLRALQERDAAVEQWLKEDVAPAYDAWKSGKTTGATLEEVRSAIRAQHSDRKSKKTA